MRYAKPSTLEEALAAVASGGTPLAGGTVLVHDVANAPAGSCDDLSLIDLDGIAPLHEMGERDGSLCVGAMVTLERAAASPLLVGAWTALAEAARAVGNPNVRRAATVGGNLALRNGVPDLHPALLVLDAHVECVGPDGSRELPAQRVIEDGVPGGALLTSIHLPHEEGRRSAFVKFAWRAASGKTIVAVAGSLALAGGAPLAPRLAAAGVAARGRASPPRRGRPCRGTSGRGRRRGGSPHRGLRAAVRARRATGGSLPPPPRSGGSAAGAHRDEAPVSGEHETRRPVRIVWNGREVERQVLPETTLQQLLHDELDDISVKAACGEGVCGSCTVLLDGKPVASCLKLALQADGREVTTAAGLLANPAAGRLVEHLVAREAFQCGYCAPGVLVSAAHALAGGRALSPEEVRLALSGNVCRCTGYQQMVDAVVAASVGEPPPPVAHPREDLHAKIAGTLRYPTDVRVAGALAGRIAWSERPSARILAIDTRAARAVPGVVAVLTAEDIPGSNRTGLELFAADHPLLCGERVRSCGDAVAVVAAESDAAARAAVERLRVTYEPLPEVLDVLDALAPGAPRIKRAGNVCSQFIKTAGDIEAGFQAADAVIEGTYRMTAGDHACMEREGGVGWLEGDTVVLAVTTLTPHLVRASAAHVLGLPETRVRIETPRMGGSFGKYLMPGVEGYLALLVHATGRPVRLVLDRAESLARSTKRHAFWGRYRLGLKRDGTFTALDAEILADAGPYTGLTPTVVAVFADEAPGAYAFPHLRVRARGVLTNNLLATAMRGFGSQQVTFGIESIVERAARTLGLDPAEVRRRNFCRTRSDGSGRMTEDPANPLAQTVEEVVRRMGPRPDAPPGWRVGRGFGSIKAKYGYPYGLFDSTVVRLSVGSDGVFTLEADVADSGSGLAAALPRLVARCLDLERLPRYETCRPLLDDPTGFLLTQGVPPSGLRRWVFQAIERLTVAPTALALAIAARLEPGLLRFLLRLAARPVDLYNALLGRIKGRLFPAGVDSYLPRTSASRGLAMAGRAAHDAAERFRTLALGHAARILSVPETGLATAEDGIYDSNAPQQRIAWGELAHQAGGTLTAIGRATLPPGGLFDTRTGNQVGPVDHMFATHGCDLAVHPETGEVRILRYVACQDVGRARDPETVRGQIVGGVAMGVGQALYERIGLPGGKVDVGGLHDYHVVTSLDAPRGIDVVHLETGRGFGPHGAKGVGEVGCVAAPAAVANALYDALGTQVPHIHVSPEEIAETSGTG